MANAATQNSVTSKGVLLVNLGSPASTKVEDVRAYLQEFLMDQYVLDYPHWLRKLIVHGFILPARPKRSAKAYQTIWWEEGSPLIVLSQRQQKLLQEQLNNPIVLGMRYGSPSIKAGLEELIAQGVREILMIPLYPHYAMSTTETVEVATRQALAELGNPAKLTILPPFYQDALFINALADSLKEELAQGCDHVLFSYHSIPERHVKKTDPTRNHCLSSENCCSTENAAAHPTCYRHQVIRTTKLVAEQTGMAEGSYSFSFQSRLGRDAWLQPFTADKIAQLAQEGVKRLVVLCPAFVTDCLETLEEIAIEGQEIFKEAGGEEFRVVPCLNTNAVWIQALAQWCQQAL